MIIRLFLYGKMEIKLSLQYYVNCDIIDISTSYHWPLRNYLVKRVGKPFNKK